MNVGSGSSGRLSYGKSSYAIKIPALGDHLMNEGCTLGAGNGSHTLSVSSKNAFFAKSCTFSPLPVTIAMSGWRQGPSKDSFSQQSVPHGIYHGYVEPFGSSVHVIAKGEDGKCLSDGLPNEEDVMHKFHSFRQFDMVQRVSGHYFDIKRATAKNQSNKWLKRIQEEW